MHTTEIETAAPTAGTVARFVTLGGAHVDLNQDFDFEPTRNDYGRLIPAPEEGRPVYTWRCQGCHAGTGQFSRTDLPSARNDANDHAAACRSIPLTDAPTLAAGKAQR